MLGNSGAGLWTGCKKRSGRRAAASFAVLPGTRLTENLVRVKENVVGMREIQ
jgi:hypothetical protein